MKSECVSRLKRAPIASQQVIEAEERQFARVIALGLDQLEARFGNIRRLSPRFADYWLEKRGEQGEEIYFSKLKPLIAEKNLRTVPGSIEHRRC